MQFGNKLAFNSAQSKVIIFIDMCKMVLHRRSYAS